MNITYTNGQTIKAAMVVRFDNRIRAVLAGHDDLTEFTQINGTWVSEECEPVQIEFGFASRVNREYNEEDFICSAELATHMIHLLFNPEEGEQVSAAAPANSLDSTAGRMLV